MDKVANPQIFRMVRVDYGTAVWPGEIDIAPETLYDDSVPVEDQCACFGNRTPPLFSALLRCASRW